MTYSTKRAIKTAAILGWTILGCAASIEAQMPQDPYPSYGHSAQAPAVAPPLGPIHGPATPNFSQSAVSYPSSSRSARLERIAQDADRHTRKAFDLASRGAYYSARAEFVRALRLVAQGLDSDRQCRAYSQALGAGLKALEEVDDFIPTGSQLEIDLPLREIIARHQTTVLKHTLAQKPSPTLHSSLANPAFTSGNHSHELSEFSVHIPTPDPTSPEMKALLPTPMEAVGAYLRYAQEQLSTAVGGEVAGSMALHGLGKLYAAKTGTELDISASRAVICFKTAAMVCPNNYLALNDLGVLLAKSGRPADACQVFEESLAIHPDPTTIANLAGVYRMLGKTHLLAEAQRRLATYQKSTPIQSASAPTVDWLTPDKFSESYASTPDARQLPPAKRPNEQQAKSPAKPSDRQADRSWPWSWMKR